MEEQYDFFRYLSNYGFLQHASSHFGKWLDFRTFRALFGVHPFALDAITEKYDLLSQITVLEIMVFFFWLKSLRNMIYCPKLLC
jgi:hypothetical protein